MSYRKTSNFVDKTKTKIPPKHVLFVHHGNSTGGAFQSMLYLLKTIDQSKYIITVCTQKTFYKDAEIVLLEAGYKTCSCDLPMFQHTTAGYYSLFKIKHIIKFAKWIHNYSKAKISLAQVLKTIKPDIVHFNSLTLAPYAYVPWQMKIPNIVHVRESVLPGYFGIRKRWLRKQLIKYVNKVIAICKDNLNKLDLPAEKGDVIYNPVPYKKFDYTISKTASRKKIGVPESAKVILMTVSGGMFIKGIVEFINAYKELERSDKHIWCLIPGYTVPRKSYLKMIFIRRILGIIIKKYRVQLYIHDINNYISINKRIIISDFVDDVEVWLSAADVICVAYVKPHFSRTILEAGAMKKPVVASRIPGILECVIDGETGVLVPPGNANILASSISNIIYNESLLASMGEANYQFTRKISDSIVSTDKVMKIYDNL